MCKLYDWITTQRSNPKEEAIDCSKYSTVERSSGKEKLNSDEHSSMHAFGKKDSEDFLVGSSKLDNTCSESQSYIGCEESNTRGRLEWK